MGRFKILVVLFLLVALLASCATVGVIDEDSKDANNDDAAQLSDKNPKDPQENREEDKGADNTGEESNAEGKDQNTPVDLKALNVNELGKIMILMYHEIGEEEAEWVRTPENFRKDLETLYEKGYRAISMKDYLNGDISTPAGTSPVIIVFDDSTKGQFNILEDEGEFVIDPDCAVGILEEFYKEHPDFGLAATFYVYYPVPFRQKDYIEQKMKYIVEKGMEIGNHAYTHENLKELDAAGIQEALGRNVQMTQEILPGYEVDSLALPYGARPADEELRKYIVSGKFENTEYHHKGVLLVGSNPARPLYHINSDATAIPRVRASEMNTAGTGLYDWLNYFEKNPEERFISDGDVNTISIPKAMEEFFDKDSTGDKVIQIYE